MKAYDLDVVMICAGMNMSGETIPSGKSLGGSETAAIQLCEALARKKHHVTLFCNTDKPHKKNHVFYSPVGWVQSPNGQLFPKGFFDFARCVPTDCIIVQRLPSLMGFEFNTKVNLLWQHDLATRTGPSNFLMALWNINRIILPSQFMKKQYQEVHGGADKIFKIIRNGIDLVLIDDAIKEVKPEERDRFRLTYTSRPERGLDILLSQVFPLILQKEPRAQLYLSRYDDPNVLPLYQRLEAQFARFGDRIVNLGNLGKADLYRHYAKSRLYIYPSMFEEISMITMQEIGACGAVMVGPWRAALPETSNGAHVLFKDDGSVGRIGEPEERGFKNPTPEFCKAIAEEAVKLMHDDSRWEKLSKVARNRAEQWTWDGVVDKWTETIFETIEQRSSDPRRLVKHFIFNSDVMAAKRYTEQLGDEKLKKSVDNYIEQYVPFVKIDDAEERRKAIGQFYEERSGGEFADYRTAFWADHEIRLHKLVDWMRRKIESKELSEDAKVLDFGCAHGGYVRALSNSFPRMKFVGVDSSPSLIRCCNQLLASKLPDGSPAFGFPQNVSFIVGDEDRPRGFSDNVEDLRPGKEPQWEEFDLIICMDTLEHLPHAEEVVGKLEQLCKPSGFMLFTVPHGHRERDEFVNKNVPPVHVRAFDLHDLRELFGKKKNYSVISISDYKEIDLDRTMPGWFLISYANDRQGAGEIDWERKFSLQGPRETVSACIMTNNNEAILHRCMRSIMKIADQIIVVDNGPSYDRTVNVAREYTDEVHAGTSPFWCYTHATQHAPDQITPGVCEMAGFETPRNESTEGAWGDWCLWIDSDEQILDGGNMWKYLRPNHLNGYAIQQHHMAVDPPRALKSDLPVRLFRNNIGMKFYGLVHEHAEFGINQGIGSEGVALGDFHIHHDGYLTESIRRGRFKRNLKLLECDRIKYPKRQLGIFLYEVRDNLHMGRYLLESNNWQMTPEAEKHLWTVVNAFREHFLAKGMPIAAEEGLTYYSDALTLLNLGIEVVVNLDVKKVGAQLNGTARRFRAMDSKEAALIVSKSIEAMAAPLEGPYVA